TTYVRGDNPWATPSGSGGSPGGSTSHVQFNTAGAFDGNSSFTTDGSGSALLSTKLTTPILNGSTSANGTITIQGNNAGASNTASSNNIILRTGNTPTNALVI